MQMKSASPVGLVLASCAMLVLAGCASQEKASVQSAPEPAPVVAPVVPVTPPPAPTVVMPVPPPQPAPPSVVVAPVPTPPVALAADLSSNIVAWDGVDKSVSVNAGELNSKFQFSLTNVSAEPVTVLAVPTSCGCTVPKVPPMPWLIPAGGSGAFEVNMNLAGKSGTIIKTVTFATDKGTKHLLVRATILPMTTATGMAPGSREQNQRMAAADRQAIFKGDCASCHVEPAKDKLGKELYVAACGICHEAEHRATMVPDLHVAKQDRNEEYWRNWVANGRQGTLMPAFALPAGGILNDAQVNSLVSYLATNMPAKAGQSNSVAAPH